ncbi:MAG TPA: DinB family protein [Nocardioides sp.]|nr:DinB family protein [Nocardioides sp.]
MPDDFQDLRGSTFESVDLTGATFRRAYLNRVTFQNVDMIGARILDADLVDAEITGEIRNVTVNGIEISAYVEAELDKQQPGRERMRPVDPAGFREAWDLLEQLWAGTVERARSLEARRPGALHESVDGEWSFVQTLRHLVYATDVWVRRVLLGEPRPWDPLSLPFDEMTPHPEVPWDRDARPPLEEVLVLRADRQATVRRVVEELTDEQLAGTTTPVDGPGWPVADAYPVREVLRTILNEEWEHRRYAERDLTVLESR